MKNIISLLIGEKDYEYRQLINVSELGKPKRTPVWWCVRYVLGWVLIYTGFFTLCFGLGFLLGELLR